MTLDSTTFSFLSVFLLLDHMIIIVIIQKIYCKNSYWSRAFSHETIIGWGFCDIQNNQGRGRGYQDLDYSGYHKNRI